MSRLSLQDLIHAIAGSVVEAQEKVQRFQITMIRRYFDEDGRPVSVDVRLPSMSPDAEEGDERMVHVPLLSLANPQVLGIKDVEIEFDVGLGAPSDPSAKPADAPDDEATDAPQTQGDIHRALGVDMGAPPNRGAGGSARVTLRVERQDLSEGMARLIQHLDKLI